VNASYSPTRNYITFPAGILQPPFYDPNADDAYNYGGIGTVIGHEMTHGFDDQGAKFDAEGNLRNWWSDADLKSFQSRAECIANQYGEFVVEENLKLQGNLVTGEAIADLGSASSSASPKSGARTWPRKKRDAAPSPTRTPPAPRAST
jgi:predicted metalloendopeptidase